MTRNRYYQDRYKAIQDICVDQYAYRMPFGAYKGHQIVTVPDQYLHWLCRSSTNLATVKRVSEELERRDRLDQRIN